MIILSALVAQTAWSWMLERGEALWKQPWPRPGLVDLAAGAFWIAGLLLAALAIGYVTRRLSLEGPAPLARPREGYAD